MDASAVIKQFYGRGGAQSEDYDLKAITIPDGTLQGRVMVEVVPKQYFRFLDLAPELRNRIYEYVLSIGDGTVRLETYPVRPKAPGPVSRIKSVTSGFRDDFRHRSLKWNKKEGKWIGAVPSPLSLLLVNKQINKEATSIAYGANCFVVPSASTATAFVANIASNTKHLTRIDLANGNYTYNSFTRLLATLRGAIGLRTIFLSDAFILSQLSSAAKDRNDVYTWAQLLSRAVSNLLLGAQATHKANGRSWKALDIVQVKNLRKYDMYVWNIGGVYVLPAALQVQQDKQTIEEFLKAFRELANGYLREE